MKLGSKQQIHMEEKETNNIGNTAKLYETLVKSILLYNSGTWGLTTKDEKDLNSFHRRLLRKVIGIK